MFSNVFVGVGIWRSTDLLISMNLKAELQLQLRKKKEKKTTVF